ncbi:MAG: GNAT family N-acetyltransferase [Candidatus Babeliaceae bacterium]|nr:GNAT family N-acetyltransferase [Candidatus Babeliaceae bacterium]
MIFRPTIWAAFFSILFLTGCWNSNRTKDGLYLYDAKMDRSFMLKHFAQDRFWLVADESYMYDPVDTLDTGIHSFVKKPVTFYIYYKAGKPVGFISYYYEYPFFGKIQFVDVDEKYHRQGIAKKMILSVLERMKKEGVRSVEIVTRLINTPALTLYEKLGFKRSHDDGKYVHLEYSFT